MNVLSRIINYQYAGIAFSIIIIRVALQECDQNMSVINNMW